MTFYTKECFYDDLRCPDCLGGIKTYETEHGTGLCVCSLCKTQFIIMEGVYRLIGKRYQKFNVYKEFLTKKKRALNKLGVYKMLTDYVNVMPRARNQTWEDEDALHWDSQYSNELVAKHQNVTKWHKITSGLRHHTREHYLFSHLRAFLRENDLVLEIGCGIAQTTRSLLRNDGQYMYFATDYSYTALMALKRLVPDSNTYFIQCAADQLPFKPKMFDFLICLGVLHHMPKKEASFKSVCSFVKNYGLIAINEPIEKDGLSPIIQGLVNRLVEPIRSVHEERVSLPKLRRLIELQGDIVAEQLEHTPLRTLLNRLIEKKIDNSITLTRLVLFLDGIAAISLGKVWGYLGPGAYHCVVKVTQNE